MEADGAAAAAPERPRGLELSRGRRRCKQAVALGVLWTSAVMVHMQHSIIVPGTGHQAHRGPPVALVHHWCKSLMQTAT